MTTPRFVVERSGEGFAVRRCDPAHQAGMTGLTIGGGLAALLGLRTGGLGGLVLTGLGGYCAYCGLTGQHPLERWMRAPTGPRPEGQTGPSSQHGVEHAAQTPHDDVEEASMESFPASDPPGRSATGPAASG